MTNIELISYYHGTEVIQEKDSIFIFLEDYAKSILEKFIRLDCNSICTSIDYGVKLFKYDSGNNVDKAYFKSLARSL